MLGQSQASFASGLNKSASFTGLLDEFRIWGRALSAAELSVYLHRGVSAASPPPDLLLYYTFDAVEPLSGGAVAVYDHSGRGHHGQLGRVAGREPFTLRYVDGTAARPSAPTLVPSRAPVASGPLILMVAQEEGSRAMFRLVDADGKETSAGQAWILMQPPVHGTISQVRPPPAPAPLQCHPWTPCGVPSCAGRPHA